MVAVNNVTGQCSFKSTLGMVKNGRPVNVGDHIPYVICNEAHAGTVETSKQSAATRAYHPDAVTAAREAFERQQSTTTSFNQHRHELSNETNHSCTLRTLFNQQSTQCKTISITDIGY